MSIISSETQISWFAFSLYTFKHFTMLLTMIVDGKRSLMIVKRLPGPYEDRWGPIVIGSLFVLSFTAQYCILMASLTVDS